MPGNKPTAASREAGLGGLPQILSPAWAVSFSGGGGRGQVVIKGESEINTTYL